MSNLGAPELLIVIVISIISLLPIAIVIWLAVALLRLRRAHDSLRDRVEKLEHQPSRS
jgi:hypothetical protein